MKRKGISLVALVITIIVLIILTGAVIMTFMEGGIIDRSREGVFKSDIKTYQSILVVKRAEEQMDIQTNKISEDEAVFIGQTLEGDAITAQIKEFKEEYKGLVEIVNGELVLGDRMLVEEDSLSTKDKLYQDWLTELGIGKGLDAGDNIDWNVHQSVLSYSSDNSIVNCFLNDPRESTEYNKKETEILNNEYTDLILPKGPTTIRYSAFQNVDSLNTVTIPAGYTLIEESAFRNCDNLEKVVLPNTIKNIKMFVFKDCKNLKEINLPEGIEEIYHSSFQGCTSLENIYVPGTVSEMGEDLFHGCTSLKNAEIGEGCTMISYGMFTSCTSLTNLTLPSSITEIHPYAFSNCTNLTTIKYNGKPEQWYNITKLNENVEEVDEITGVFDIVCGDGTVL